MQQLAATLRSLRADLKENTIAVTRRNSDLAIMQAIENVLRPSH
jgi:hypothetical protein